ncbi:MAG: protein kinase [Planctomycetota bacterium]
MSKPPPIEFQPGMEVVPGYTLMTPLGSGMAGDVWQAQAAGGIRVALKVVRSLSDVGGRKELKALKTIRDVHHPNLCPLFGFWTKDADGRVLADGETEELTLDSSHMGQLPPDMHPKMTDSGALDGTMAVGGLEDFAPPSQQNPASHNEPVKSKVKAEQLIVVMGLGDCTLFDRLKFIRQEAGLAYDDIHTPCGLDAAETIRYLRASASAIDLLNLEHDVYHFDIKPQNILLVGGEAQVCDFGLAKKIEADMRETQQTMATPAYASPEILEGQLLKRAAGETLYVDQYSLAVTYFELRTGLLPFDVTTHASMLVAKSTGKLNLEALPPAERKVLTKAMRRKPTERYRSCTEFIDALAVAAGVDKAGGITMGRLIASAAVLVCLTGVGLAGWKYTNPEHFDSIFSRSQARAADQLAMVKESFEANQSRSFDDSAYGLIDVANKSAEIARSSGEKGRKEALAVYRNVMDRLCEAMHQALAESESSVPLTDDRGKKFRLAVSLLDPNGMEAPEETDRQHVLEGHRLLLSSEDPSQQRAARSHQLLHDTARVRFDLLRQKMTPTETLDRIRNACSRTDAELSLATSKGVDAATIATLPLLSATQNNADQWTSQDWLDPARLEDVIRAEKFQSKATNNEAPSIRSRWLGVREAFLVSLSPVITGNDRSQLPSDVEQRLLMTFPDLELEAKLADLRIAIRDSQWNNATELIAELTPIVRDTDGKRALKLMAGMLDRRQRENAVTALRESLAGEGINRAEAAKLRLSEPIEGYLAFLGQRLLDQDVVTPAAFHLQFEDADWVSSETATDLPDVYLEASVVSRLRSMGSDQGSDLTGDFDRWIQIAERIKQTDSSAALIAAMEMERHLVDASDPESLPEMSGRPEILNQVSPAYSAFLRVCSQAARQEELGDDRETLTSLPASALRSLGRSRLRAGCSLFALAASQVSQIDEDSITDRRYSTGGPMNALEYLSAGKFLAEHLDDGPTDRLAAELLILSAFTKQSFGTAQLDWRQRFSTTTQLESASNQLLLALHQSGIRSIDDGNATANQIWNACVQPTGVLVKRFGIDRFGVQTGDSAEKRVLLQEVFLPTVRAAIDLLVQQKDSDVFPTKFAPLLKERSGELLDFAELAFRIYSDPLVKQQYESDSDWRRERILLAISAAATREASDRRADMLWHVVDAAVNLLTLEGDDLLSLADRIERLGANSAPLNYLRGVGHYRLSEKQSVREEKRQLVRKAFEDMMRSLESLNQDAGKSELAQKHQYEVLARSTDIAVQLAFLTDDIDRKLELLLPASERGQRALDLYRDSWNETVNTVVQDARISLANAYEDIAFYCSQGDEPEIRKRRVESFKKAISLFSEVFSRSEESKSRYSLGRAQFRYALSLPAAEKESVLEDARRSLGKPPAISTGDEISTEQLADNAQWYVWKLQVEDALKNSADGRGLADAAFQYVTNERVSIEYRNLIAIECATAYGKTKAWKQAIQSLLVLEEKGPFDSVVKRMGMVSDFATFYVKPVDNNSLKRLSRIVAGLELPKSSKTNEETTYQLAKLAMLASSEQVNETVGQRDMRWTKLLLVDLSALIRKFEAYAKSGSNKKYMALATVLARGDSAAMNRNPDAMMAYAVELAELIRPEDSYRGLIPQFGMLSVYTAMIPWMEARLQGTEATRKADSALRKALRNRKTDDLIVVLERLSASRPSQRTSIELLVETLREFE